MFNILRTAIRDESGASLIEYSILIGLISAAVSFLVFVIGGWVGNSFACTFEFWDGNFEECTITGPVMPQETYY